MSDSISKYVQTKEYSVILKNYEDLDSFYAEMADYGRYSGSSAPERIVACTELKPLSRATWYMLTEWEAEELKSDPRVESVSIHPRYIGGKAGTYTTTVQTSSNWNKSGSTSNVMLNWALLRCTEGVNRVGWGSDSTANATGTVRITSTGKNVDCVIVDAGNPDTAHPEFAVNANGTGGSRMVSYNWFQHNPEVTGGAAGTYNNPTNSHSVHCSGTVAGNTQGWARDANIYNIYYDAGNPGNFSYVFDYVRAFHRNKSINAATGRKNPTITNNSWGQSIFPSEWSFSDITAVTYRGTRYTPPAGGTITYTGYSGICSTTTRLATLLGFENFGNRITTTGSIAPIGGSFIAKPPSWTQEGSQIYLTTFTEPDASYTATIQGPAVIDLICNVAIECFTGTATITNGINITQGATVVAALTDGPFTDVTVETNIRRTVTLADTAEYTIEFTSDIDVSLSGIHTVGVAMSVTIKAEATPASANVTEIANALVGGTGLTSSTTPTSGGEDDGYWQLELPFNIEFLGVSYATVYVGTNHYLTFGGGSVAYSNLGPTTPNFPKIMWSCADNSVQRIYYGSTGTTPNRKYYIRVEGNAATSGTLGSPFMVNEYTFYESNPSQIDLQLGANNRKTSVGGGFTTEQLNSWGFIAGQRIPLRVPACDSDVIDAMNEGVIFVGAAGNGLWKHDVPGGIDWDNTFEMANRYPASVANPYYICRGTSPTANDTGMPNICVGATDVTSVDQKSYYSDCGPGVDIWAPGTSILSSYLGGVSDNRNASYQLGKISGTSMASPQVCGVIACALEQNPHWNQSQAKAYITGIATQGQLTATSGGPADIRDLQGGPNLHLYYKKERPIDGQTIPQLTQGARPSVGMAWPRPKIYRFGR
jgi:hypothetical protein